MEWPLIEGEPLVLHTAKKPEPEIPEKVECPDYAHLLPDEVLLSQLVEFTVETMEKSTLVSPRSRSWSFTTLCRFLTALAETEILS